MLCPPVARLAARLPVWSSARRPPLNPTTLPPFFIPERARRDLGVDDVFAVLHAQCRSPFGAEALDDEPFPKTLEALLARMDLVLEAHALAELSVAPDFGAVVDVRPLIDLIGKEGVLGPAELVEFGKTFDGVSRVRALLESRAESLPKLFAIADPMSDARTFVQRVRKSFDDEGNFTDEASPTLKELRTRVRQLRQDAKGQLDDLVREYDDLGVLRDRNFTIRNDRYVLPVRADVQARVEGIVHDASQTGQTVFIEPRALMQVGNRIKIATSACREEEHRILVELTKVVRERADALSRDLVRIGELEATFARATFTSRIGAVRPRILTNADDVTKMDLQTARHPLLEWMRSEAQRTGVRGGPAPKTVIPSDIGTNGKRALVISGPNAGGKTVALKTVGLCCMMVRAGLPIPADSASAVPLLAALFCTLGDDQSLEEALSSFSGHLTALREILDALERQVKRGAVVVLLDELLSGTDPAQGAALAQAVLERLVSDGRVLTVATTHYERLKTLAIAADDEDRSHFRNASVALDEEGRPTFTLRLDEVGGSNALDAARRHGLNGAIIERADALLDPNEKDLHAVLARLSAQSAHLEQRLEAASTERRRAENDAQRLERKLLEVKREKERLRVQGARALKNELKAARRKIAEAIEKVKAGASAQELDALSHDLLEEERKADVVAESLRPETDRAAPKSIEVGAKVEVATSPGTVMDVLEIDGDVVVVGRGALRMRVDRKDLLAPSSSNAAVAPGKAGKQDRKRGRKQRTAKIANQSEPKTQDNTLDLRGVRVEEGLDLMEAFLDTLLQAGRTKAWILHGHGTGAMKRGVRDALKTSRYVSKFGPAEHDDGGDALTAVTMGE